MPLVNLINESRTATFEENTLLNERWSIERTTKQTDNFNKSRNSVENPTNMYSIILLSVLSTAFASRVLELNDDNFKSQLEDMDLALVKFYAPW